jgi:hypothetical protein
MPIETDYIQPLTGEVSAKSSFKRGGLITKGPSDRPTGKRANGILSND